MRKLWDKVQNDPIFFKKLNGWLTVVWFFLAFPICIFLAESVPFLVFISVYAVFTGHLSTWQAGKVEVEQKTGSTLNDEDRQWLIELIRNEAGNGRHLPGDESSD